MKILWVSPWFGNYRVPVYKFLNKLCDGDFYLICSKENTSVLVRKKLKAALGSNVVIMEGETCTTMGSDDSDFANKTLVLKRQPGLYKAIKRINPDVIITEGFGGWAPAGIRYSILHRKKLCIYYERTAYVERNSPFWRSFYRMVVGRVANAFAINGTLTEQYLNNNLRFTNTPKVKGCMSADSFGLAKAVATVTDDDRIKLTEKLELDNGLTFLFVGQMVERKGIAQLLKAWEEHKNYYPHDNLIVIGAGVLLDSLRNKYENERSIHILGSVSYDNIYLYYALCDVFIMPTLEDNWCLVIPEAMACGKPVACSIYNGGVKDLVIDGVDGYSFDPLQEFSIIDTLDKFHHSDLKSMGERAKEIESNYTPDKAARRIYDACINTLQK